MGFRLTLNWTLESDDDFASRQLKVEGQDDRHRHVVQSWRVSDILNNKSGQRLNGALVVAYVIITVNHMALDLFYVSAQTRHSDMFQMGWPSDAVECDQHGQCTVGKEP